ncbi:MAG: response regulator [Christensenellaceae bacterium]
MDIRMPNMNGVVATQSIKAKYPDVKVVILTTFDDSDYILNAINNGASGYLLKDIGSTALIDAVKNAYAGDTILPAKIARRIADAAKNVSSDREIKLKRAFSLSDREVEIALMLYEGFTNRQISSALKSPRAPPAIILPLLTSRRAATTARARWKQASRCCERCSIRMFSTSTARFSILWTI